MKVSTVSVHLDVRRTLASIRARTWEEGGAHEVFVLSPTRWVSFWTVLGLAQKLEFGPCPMIETSFHKEAHLDHDDSHWTPWQWAADDVWPVRIMWDGVRVLLVDVDGLDPWRVWLAVLPPEEVP